MAISIADTIGVANPKLVYDIVSHLVAKYPEVTWNMHLHNTRDMALANTLAALDAGVSRFDGGVAGLGGCPYAPGATGNIATEDMVNMLDGMGIETGIDLDKLLTVARMHKEFIPHNLDSSLLRAGRGNVLLPAPERQQKIAS
jgi:hydroxymethylglutaryl-CoA lyase